LILNIDVAVFFHVFFFFVLEYNKQRKSPLFKNIFEQDVQSDQSWKKRGGNMAFQTPTLAPSGGSSPNCRPSPCRGVVSSGCCRYTAPKSEFGIPQFFMLFPCNIPAKDRGIATSPPGDQTRIP